MTVQFISLFCFKVKTENTTKNVQHRCNVSAVTCQVHPTVRQSCQRREDEEEAEKGGRGEEERGEQEKEVEGGEGGGGEGQQREGVHRGLRQLAAGPR